MTRRPHPVKNEELIFLFKLQGIFKVGRVQVLTFNFHQAFAAKKKQKKNKNSNRAVCRKTKTKAIIPTNHNSSRERDEPITISSNYL